MCMYLEYCLSYISESATITSFTSSPSSRNINVGTTITFTCTVSSTTFLPVNVSISSQNREGNLTYVINSASRTFTVSTVAQCIDYRFLCTVYNGYGSVYTRGLYKTVTCPFKLLKDKTNTTVNATVGSYSAFYAYYSGYPAPSYTWYRRLSQVEIKMNSYRTYWSHSRDTYMYIYLQINNVRLEDAGQYSVHINSTGRGVIVIFTLNVNPAPTSSSIAIGQKSETQNVGTLQQNSTMKAEELGPSTIQPFISATGLGIGIAVGVITTFLILGVFLLVSRLLKSRDVKDKEVKTKSINKIQDKDKDKVKVEQSDYDNTAYNPSEEETYENLELN
ncbi:hypothetical protein SNE40_002449 [Patella caerulea]|uniref:Immunoglobulin domain-containing protein n=1 Tax=Patella caerulea TaxID=87958 RepID=A0AAN8PZV5_PATCE